MNQTITQEIANQQFALKHCIASREDSENGELYPELTTLSPAFFYRFLPVPADPGPLPEYAYVRDAHELGFKDRNELGAYQVFVSSWNNTWECRELRTQLFEKEVPAQLRWV